MKNTEMRKTTMIITLITLILLFIVVILELINNNHLNVNEEKNSIIDIRDTATIKNLIDLSWRGEDSTNLDSELEKYQCALFPTLKDSDFPLCLDSLTLLYGKPLYNNVYDFKPSESKGRSREEDTNLMLKESNSISDVDRLSPILSRIDEFKLETIVWKYKDNLQLEVIYLLCDSTMIPIDGWIADKNHFIFKRI